MHLTFLLRGLVLGFFIAAPVGPIGILCIRRTLVSGQLAGLLTGLGAATADGIYGCMAGFGLTLVSNFLVHQAGWLRLAGGVFLCYLGLKTWLANAQETIDLTDSAEATANETWGTYAAMYASTVFLTLTNPMTILSFAAVFAGLGLGGAAGSYGNAALLVLGVFTGSALWWLLLSGGVGLLRTRFGLGRLGQLKALNRISGLILLVFGIIALSPQR